VAGTCGYSEELLGSINAGNFLTSCKVYWLASQEGLCSMASVINPLNAELNPICHLLELLETHPILHISRIRVK